MEIGDWEPGEWREVSDDELPELIELMFKPDENYSQEDVLADMNLMINMFGHVASGFIRNTGVVKGRRVRFYGGNTPIDGPG